MRCTYFWNVWPGATTWKNEHLYQWCLACVSCYSYSSYSNTLSNLTSLLASRNNRTLAQAWTLPWIFQPTHWTQDTPHISQHVLHQIRAMANQILSQPIRNRPWVRLPHQTRLLPCGLAVRLRLRRHPISPGGRGTTGSTTFGSGSASVTHAVTGIAAFTMVAVGCALTWEMTVAPAGPVMKTAKTVIGVVVHCCFCAAARPAFFVCFWVFSEKLIHVWDEKTYG